jgi:geranylgeranyl pyrophosphate synthase
MTTDLASLQDRCNNALKTALGDMSSEFNVAAAPLLGNLFDASDYALNGGGKRVRPALVFSAAEAIDASVLKSPGLDAVACAVELIHAYSLVHDDLPAMDDDDVRRGRATVHRAFDEATAVLVGDALQARAFEILVQAEELSDSARLQLVGILSAASGARGMVGGQMIDVAAVDADIDLDHLQAMHSLKTGALIRASVALGGVVANADSSQMSALDGYACNIGLAFQVCDDILDASADSQTLGKTAGADAARNKPTYVSLLGLKGAEEKAQGLLEAALKAIETMGDSADSLRELARYILARSS